MPKQKDMLGVILGAALSVSVMLGIVMFFLSGGIESIYDYIVMPMVVILVIGASVLIAKKMGNVKAGLPADDELSKRVSWKAGAYAYYTTIWLAIALMWYNGLFTKMLGLPKMGTMHLTGLIILLPSIVFICLPLLYNRKGNV